MATVVGTPAGVAISSAPPIVNPSSPQAGMPELWNGVSIPVIGGTGEFSTGKTLFGLTIDPGPRTLVWDNEGSSLSYRGIGFKHRDMAMLLRKKFGTREYTAKERFLLWRDELLACEDGKYTVGMVDPFSEIETGLAQYVDENPDKFGYTAAQFARSSGIFWGAVKDYQQQLLDDIRTKFQTFYYVTHMRDEFKGGAPTGKREPKGKETLWQLASLFLEFRRDKNTEIPSAVVLKSRVAKTEFIGGRLKITNCLPDRLPEATPEAIRGYIANPPDFNNLKATERFQPDVMSEDERLRLRAYIAEREAETAATGEDVAKKRQAAAAAQRAALAGGGGATAPESAAGGNGAATAPTNSAPPASRSTASKSTPANPANPTTTPIGPEKKARVIELCKAGGIEGALMLKMASRIAGRTVEKLSDVTELHAAALIGELLLLQPGAGADSARKDIEGSKEAPSAPAAVSPSTPPASTPEALGDAAEPPVAPAVDPYAGLADTPGSITEEQRAKLAALRTESNWQHEGPGGVQEFFAKNHVQTIRNLSEKQAARAIVWRERVKGGEVGAKYEDDCPF